MVKKIIHKHFDVRMAFAGAAVMGIIVFAINASHGWTLGLTAASKQLGYTFLASGILMRMTENLSLKWQSKYIAYAVAVLVPVTLSVLLTYGVHSLKGTPEPLMSVIPTAILSPPGFFWWAMVARKKNQSLLGDTSQG